LQLHQLIPRDRVLETGDLLAELDVELDAGEELPYTVVNFVSSVDGHAAFHGRSGPLGDAADRELFHALRARADAVLAGTATVRVERYGRLIRDAGARERRRAAGRRPEPLMCLVTRTGELPGEAPVFSEPEARIVVFAPGGTEPPAAPARVEVVALDAGELTLTTALRRLRADFGVRLLLCEGGPTLFAALLQERLVDELFLTLAPKLAGGGPAPAVTQGPELPRLVPLELVWALEHAGSLFLRYRLRADPPPA
jgi:riboflavin biosynthesis pyrimidine reductase